MSGWRAAALVGMASIAAGIALGLLLKPIFFLFAVLGLIDLVIAGLIAAGWLFRTDAPTDPVRPWPPGS